MARCRMGDAFPDEAMEESGEVLLRLDAGLSMSIRNYKMLQIHIARLLIEAR